jgi:cytosine deaminase
LSHASVLGAVPDDEFARISDQILALDLGVITLPAANLISRVVVRRSCRRAA